MTIRGELKVIALAIYWLILVGLVAPWLISAPNTPAVVTGFALLVFSAYATYRYIRSQLNKEDEDAL